MHLGIHQNKNLNMELKFFLILLHLAYLGNGYIGEKMENKKIKILVCGLSSNKGGVESVIMNYYKHINKDIIQFDFLVNEPNIPYAEEIKNMGGNIIILPSRRHLFKFQTQAKQFFKNHAKEYQAIWQNNCTLSNIAYIKYAKKYGIKKRIMHAHNSKNMGNILTLILHKINKLLLPKYATHFWSCDMCASKYFYLKKIIQSNKHQIINNAINVQTFTFNSQVRQEYRKKLKLQPTDVAVGHIGRFHFQKNHMFLIEVFNEYQKLQPQAQLFLVGEGEDKAKVQQHVANLGLQNKVHFLGARQDVPALLQAMDIFLFPSLFEGLSVALIEAQTSGVTIFTSTTVSPNTKLVKNYFNISLNQSPCYWASIMQQKFNDGYPRKSNAQQVIDAGFDIQKEAEKLTNFLISNK